MPPAVRRGISRFIVMATLQAARASRLGLPLESARSWGLNRAIFYAAAKQGFGRRSSEGGTGEGETTGRTPPQTYALGDDYAYRDTASSKLLFAIGDETQTEERFERQIIDRFGPRRNFDRAWKEAEAIIASADRATLESARGFYEQVYKPRRDALKDAWSEMVLGQEAASPPHEPR